MSKQKKGMVPELRFPEFEKEPNWPCVKLNAVAKRSTSKNKGEKVSRVLTNSAVDGVVDQRDYFEKDIAVKGNLESYYIVDEGDYVYNPRISSTAPVGPISKNKIGKGVMSPLYTVFKFNSKKNGFFEQFFKSSRWHGYLQTISNSGARHDRMSVTSSEFMAMPVPSPGDMEQQKIADCLASIDELIALHTQKLDALKDHKKGLMQQLFPVEGEAVPKLRFPEFIGQDTWKEINIGSIGKISMCRRVLKEETQPNGDVPFFKIGTFGRQADAYIDRALFEEYRDKYSYPKQGEILVSAAGTIGRLVVFDGGEAYFQDSNIVWVENDESKVLNEFLFFCYSNLNWSTDTNTIARLYNDSLRGMSIFITSLSEQKKIASFLKSIDLLIGEQSEKVENLKNHKKGLVQRIFPVMDEVV